MTPTELKLTAIHKGPVARLADISKAYRKANRRGASAACGASALSDGLEGNSK